MQQGDCSTLRLLQPTANMKCTTAASPTGSRCRALAVAHAVTQSTTKREAFRATLHPTALVNCNCKCKAAKEFAVGSHRFNGRQ